MLNNVDYKNLINFSCEIGKISNNFYENCLNLVSKFFNYKHLIFVPEILNTNSTTEINKVYYKNFYSINIQTELIREFKHSYYKDSIFQPLNMPEELLDKDVIVIEDIMPYEEYLKTINAEFLKKYKYHYRLDVNLTINEIKLGVLCILKTKSQGDFSKKELETTKILGNIISIQYNNFLNLSKSILIKDIFEKCHGLYQNGLIIWDNNQEIIETTNLAQEYLLDISSTLNSSNNFLYSDLIPNKNASTPIKKIIYYLSLNHLQNPSKKKIDYTVNNYVYSITMETITLPELSGNMKTCTFAKITKSINKSNFSKTNLKDLYNLTDREVEIIELIKQGYSNNEISKLLYLSLNTVKTHITNIYKKLNVNSRTSLISKL